MQNTFREIFIFKNVFWLSARPKAAFAHHLKAKACLFSAILSLGFHGEIARAADNRTSPGKLASAVTSVRAAQEPAEVEQIVKYCCKLWNAKKRRPALNTIDECLIKHPKSLTLFSLRSRFYCDIYEDELAIADAQKVLCQKPDDERAAIVEAEVFNRTSKPAEALAASDRALKYHPNSTGLGYMRALSLLALKRNQEGLKELDRICSLEPNFSPFRRSRGRCLMEMKLYKRAAVDYLWLTTGDVENAPSAFATLGDCYFFIKDLANARKAYENALKLDKDELNGHRGMESVYRATGNTILADKENREVRRIESDLSP